MSPWLSENRDVKRKYAYTPNEKGTEILLTYLSIAIRVLFCFWHQFGESSRYNTPCIAYMNQRRGLFSVNSCRRYLEASKKLRAVALGREKKKTAALCLTKDDVCCVCGIHIITM